MTTDNMIVIRDNVVKRVVNLCDARKAMHDGIGAFEHAGMVTSEVWEDWPLPMANKAKPIEALQQLAEVVATGMNDDIMAAAEQAARLIARDVIAPIARASSEPVVALTSNAYMPPIRDIEDAEAIFQADDNGDVWECFTQALESAVDEEGLVMGCPDYDNMLYVVDVRRWSINVRDEVMDDPNAWLDSQNYSALRD